MSGISGNAILHIRYVLRFFSPSRFWKIKLVPYLAVFSHVLLKITFKTCTIDCKLETPLKNYNSIFAWWIIPKICLQNQKRNLEDCLGGATGGDLLVDIVSKRCTLSDRDILDGSWVWDWGKLGFGESSNQITNLMRELMLWKLTRIILIFIVLIALCRVWPCAACTATEP